MENTFKRTSIVERKEDGSFELTLNTHVVMDGELVDSPSITVPISNELQIMFIREQGMLYTKFLLAAEMDQKENTNE